MSRILLVLDAGCLMLDAGCWMLDAGILAHFSGLSNIKLNIYMFR